MTGSRWSTVSSAVLANDISNENGRTHATLTVYVKVALPAPPRISTIRASPIAEIITDYTVQKRSTAFGTQLTRLDLFVA